MQGEAAACSLPLIPIILTKDGWVPGSGTTLKGDPAPMWGKETLTASLGS